MEAIPSTVHTVQASYQRAHREINSTYPFFLRLRPLQELGLDQPCSLPTWLVAFRRLSEDFYTGGDRDVAY